MFTESMDIEELIAEFKNDLANAFRVCDARQEHVDKAVRKSRMFPVYAFKWITTERRNQWLIRWEARNKNQTGDMSLVTFVAVMQMGRERYCMMRTAHEGEDIYILYTAHFFSRYAERAGINLNGLELIGRYFRMNASYGFCTKADRWFNMEKMNVYGSSCDGVALGVRVNTKSHVILFKTFITYEMLKGEQIENFTMAENLRREIHEKVGSMDAKNITVK